MTLIISFFLWSLVSMFTPTNAKSTAAIMVARVAIGIAQGFIIPSVRKGAGCRGLEEERGTRARSDILGGQGAMSDVGEKRCIAQGLIIISMIAPP